MRRANKPELCPRAGPTLNVAAQAVQRSVWRKDDDANLVAPFTSASIDATAGSAIDGFTY
jgi:hypothetical protein